jgi:hypothetical protein
MKFNDLKPGTSAPMNIKTKAATTKRIMVLNQSKFLTPFGKRQIISYSFPSSLPSMQISFGKWC